MKNLAALVKNKQDNIAQHLLSQVDTLGHVLSHIGVENQINRHTLIGQAWVQKHRLDGEIARLDVIVHNKLRPIKKIRSKVDTTLDSAIDYLPSAIAKRAHRTHAHIKRLSGG